MRFIVLLCLSVGVSYSVVEFINSALYDIHDFKGVDEVHITKCDNGCLIFAATMGESFVQYPENLDAYAMNLIIYDYDGLTIYSNNIAKLAQLRDNDQRKIPLTIKGRGNISVINKNPPNAHISTIVLYVVEFSTAEEISYEVYDLAYSSGATITPQSDIVTFLSASNFRIQSPKSAEANSVTAWMVGFDNALERNKDGCPYVFETPDSPSYPGFSIMATSSIMSLVIGQRSPIQLQPDLQYSSTSDIGVAGFITSPGWNGCSKATKGEFQSFRAADDLSTDTYILSNNNDLFNVFVDVLPHFDAMHKLEISDEENMADPTVVTGTLDMQLRFPWTNYLMIDFQGMKGDQGFIMRYSATLLTKGPATVTSSSMTTTVPPLTKGPATESSTVVIPSVTSSVTAPAQPPTTKTSSSMTSTVSPSNQYLTTSSGIRASGCMLSMLLLSLFF